MKKLGIWDASKQGPISNCLQLDASLVGNVGDWLRYKIHLFFRLSDATMPLAGGAVATCQLPAHPRTMWFGLEDAEMASRPETDSGLHVPDGAYVRHPAENLLSRSIANLSTQQVNIKFSNLKK